MMMPSLTLPLVDGAAVAALRRLGRGLRLPFEVADQRGELLLEPGRSPQGRVALRFDSACGELTFSEPGPVLSLMGECPVPLAEADNDPDSWFWAVFQHHLSPQLQSLFGYLRLAGPGREQGFSCRLTVTLGDSKVVGRLSLLPQSLMSLYAAGPWKPVIGQWPASFPLAVAVTLGHSQLPITQLRGVRPGDVLMPERTLFDVQGTGHLRLGGHQLRGQIDDESGPLCFTLISIEETSVGEDFAEQYRGHEPEPYDGDESPVDVLGREPFGELMVALSVRCGSLSLSLGELRQLAPGAVLGISGYAPGMAGLYYGDRPIGHGQLVDVDGRLGLQLSRVIFSR
jgi:type III secretion protein Q